VFFFFTWRQWNINYPLFHHIWASNFKLFPFSFFLPFIQFLRVGQYTVVYNKNYKNLYILFYPKEGSNISLRILATCVHLLPTGGSSTIHICTQTIHRTTQFTNWEECGAVPRLCAVYPGICLTTEEKVRKNLSQDSRRVPVGMTETEYTERNIYLRVLWINNIYTWVILLRCRTVITIQQTAISYRSVVLR
jgi:hypothetical protein